MRTFSRPDARKAECSDSDFRRKSKGDQTTRIWLPLASLDTHLTCDTKPKWSSSSTSWFSTGNICSVSNPCSPRTDHSISSSGSDGDAAGTPSRAPNALLRRIDYQHGASALGIPNHHETVFVIDFIGVPTAAFNGIYRSPVGDGTVEVMGNLRW